LSVQAGDAPKRDISTYDRFVDVASLVLISLAAVLSALCGYQSGRWGGRSALLYNEAANYRVMAAEAHDTANELRMIDIGVFLRYADAYNAHDDAMKSFLFARFRPEAKRAIEAWIATKPLHNRNAPSSPFAMPQYHLQAAADSKRDNAKAATFLQDAQEANHHSEDFLLLTVIFAGVSFLAGVSTKMAFPRHVIVVGLGTIAILYGAIRLIRLPFL
jgi:hypothetical protein